MDTLNKSFVQGFQKQAAMPRGFLKLLGRGRRQISKEIGNRVNPALEGLQDGLVSGWAGARGQVLGARQQVSARIADLLTDIRTRINGMPGELKSRVAPIRERLSGIPETTNVTSNPQQPSRTFRDILEMLAEQFKL